jgi:Fibronectin type 3 domain-containing protein
LKKKFLIFIFFLLVSIFNSIPVFASPGGLLDGKSMNSGLALDDIKYTSTNATDSDLNTCILVDHTNNYKVLWYKFNNPVIINGYICKTQMTNSNLSLYDSSKNPLYSHGLDYHNTLVNITAVNNVSYIAITNDTSGAYIYNFDVFGPSLPTIPMGLSQTVTGNNLTLNWSANPSTDNITGYEVFINGVSQGSVATNSFSKSSLPIGSYSAYITATNSVGTSAQSNTVNFTVGNIPSIPSGVSVSGSGGSGTLTWSANPSEDNVTSYNIYENGSKIGTSDKSSYDFSGLTSGTYQFTVSAVNAGGESAQSSAVSYTVTVSDVPGQPTATAGDTQVTLSWSSITGATGYNVKRASVSGGPYTSIANGITTTTYTNTNLTNGTTYYYVVSAISTSGESDNSAEVSATPQASSTGSSTNLLATAGSSQISLSWDAVTGATSYNVKRATTAGGSYTTIAQNITGTTYNDTSASAGVTYYYVVTAVTSDGESANSNEASATLSTPENNDRLYVLLDLAEQAQLSVTSSLSDNTGLTWTSSDPSVATVDANGKVTAVAEGTCKITAAKSDGTFSDYIPIKVAKNAEELRLALYLNAGESKQLWISDDNTSVTWTSMDSSIASVDNTGKVTGVAKGLCIIQAELSGKTYYIYARVNA